MLQIPAERYVQTVAGLYPEAPVVEAKEATIPEITAYVELPEKKKK